MTHANDNVDGEKHEHFVYPHLPHCPSKVPGLPKSLWCLSNAIWRALCWEECELGDPCSFSASTCLPAHTGQAMNKVEEGSAWDWKSHPVPHSQILPMWCLNMLSQEALYISHSNPVLYPTDPTNSSIWFPKTWVSHHQFTLYVLPLLKSSFPYLS